MKQFLFSIAFVLVALPVLSQTAMFNHYKNRSGVQVSVIRNYDIGDHTKVTVTMLEAADLATYNELRDEIKAMNHVEKNGKLPDAGNAPFAIGKVNSITMNVSVVDRAPDADSAQLPAHQIDIQRVDPLPGDAGVYLVCGSSKTMTILVFHCPDQGIYQRIMKFVLIHSIEK